MYGWNRRFLSLNEIAMLESREINMAVENRKEEKYGDLFTTNRDASRWNDLYEDTSSLFNFNMAERRDRVCQLVFERFTPERAILDLGCGAGVVMEKLLQNGYSVTGVDRSSDMLDLSRARLAGFPPDAYQLRTGTCESLPFDDQQFDVVLCIGVFGYIDDVVGALLEIRRVLRPGGLLLISVRNPYNSVIFDPVEAAFKLARKLLRRFRGAGRTTKSTPAAVKSTHGDASDRPPQFRIDILQRPRPLIAGVKRCGYDLDFFEGYGFGPVALAGKRLLPHAWDIRLSNFLNSFLDAAGLNGIKRWIGDVSIYGFVKPCDQP